MSSFRRTISIKRRAAGSWANGVFTAGAETDSSIQASVQPLKPEEVRNLPEGRRDRNPYWVITSTALNLASSATPDFVYVDSERYEIEQREVWQNNVINHYRYLVIKALEA